MWLINTESYQLEEFIPEQAPPYAILSHRWGAEEVLFRHMQDDKVARARQGYHKILKTCELAANRKIAHAWVDTCCINKESSAELSEAINSMFEWYANSAICFVYLEDVQSYPRNDKEFGQSAWFTRGWTLQELLAPHSLEFYNYHWQCLGSMYEMTQLLSRVTNIAREVLVGGRELSECSIVERMTWAASRTTTRREDQAYCLLGIFHVNMPLLYGEGDRAFIRLQEEIIRRDDDASIFLWQNTTLKFSGLLAPSPKCFEDIPYLLPPHLEPHFSSAFALTNQGLSIPLLLRFCAPRIYKAAFLFTDLREACIKSIEITLYRASLESVKFWHRLNTPSVALMDGILECCWRGWDHQVTTSDPKCLDVIVGEANGRSHNVLRSYIDGHDSLINEKYEISLTVEEPLHPFIDSISMVRKDLTPDDEVWSSAELDVLTAPLPKVPVRCSLPEQYGVLAMLKMTDIANDIGDIALGVSFEGTVFCIATSKEQVLNNRDSKVLLDDHNLPSYNYEDLFVQRINELIDEVDEAPTSTKGYAQAESFMPLQWTRGLRETIYDEPEPPTIEPGSYGVWAIKNHVIEAYIPLCYEVGEDGKTTLLKIDAELEHDRRSAEYTVRLSICHSKV